MPQFAAHLSLMYTELPLLDRFAAAAHDGFRAVELHFPYAFDPREIAARLQDNGLHLVLQLVQVLLPVLQQHLQFPGRAGVGVLQLAQPASCLVGLVLRQFDQCREGELVGHGVFSWWFEGLR